MAGRQRNQHGFTLVELMIGMVLGLFILLGLITLWVNINRNNTELSKANRMIENGRLTLQLLQNDVAHAGFLAGFVPNYDDLTFATAPALSSTSGGQVPSAVPDPCLGFSAANWTDQHKADLLGIVAQSYEVPVAGTAPICAGVVTSPKAGTHVLVVRHMETCTAGSGTAECSSSLGQANPNVYFQVSRCSSDTDTHLLGTSGLNLQTRACDGTLAPIHRYSSTLYYIRTFNEAGDGVPTLMRSAFGANDLTGDPTDPAKAPNHHTVQPLVEGIEEFVVQFGLDNLSDSGAAVNLTQAITWASADSYVSPTNRGDGNPDSYVECTAATPCTAAQLVNAVTVKIYLLVRAEQATPGHTDAKTYVLAGREFGPYNDAFKRHVFTQTIRLTNVSGRRETP